MKEVTVGNFSGPIETTVRIFRHGNGAEQQRAAHGERNPVLLVQADWLIAAPEFASAGSVEQR